MKRRAQLAFTLIELMIAITIIAILAAILIPNFKKARVRSQLTTCVANCKTVGTALEMYAVDYGGRYPQNSGGAGLDQLITHGNLARLPTCPAAGIMTFIDFNTTTQPDSYSFTCVGTNHFEAYGTVVGGFPQYSNDGGVIQQPTTP
jgi:prepilin-type N-terminal cleavage/methylation domain-containing protein